MNYVPKPNTANLFKNDKKTDEKHPDYRGDAVIDKQLLMDLIAKGEDPVKIAVSLWKNKAKSGAVYLRLTFQEPMDPQKKAPAQAPLDEEDDEDVPF